jgi:hypothetical protein
MSIKFCFRLAKVCGLLLLLMAALGVQRCTEGVAARMSYTAPAARPRPVAVLPVAYILPTAPKVLRQFAQLLDTGRVGGPSHLHRKANPRNRWLPAQPAYLPGLPPRPPQHVLDSLAALARRA